MFHAFTGTDNVGRFSGIGKTKWFQQYIKADSDIAKALLTLPTDGELTQDVTDAIAAFVCSVYSPRGIHITSIPDLRWHLFCKRLAESSALPPTVGALEQHVKRVRVQSRVWHQASIMQQTLFEPLEFGYCQDAKGQPEPITTSIPPAPQSITELVKCQCRTNCTSQRCSCKRQNLTCTDLCSCSDECENDVDANTGYITDSDDEL